MWVTVASDHEDISAKAVLGPIRGRVATKDGKPAERPWSSHVIARRIAPREMFTPKLLNILKSNHLAICRELNSGSTIHADFEGSCCTLITSTSMAFFPPTTKRVELFRHK